MAIFVNTDSKIVVNSINLSGWITGHDLPREADMHDKTTFGQTTHIFTSGLLNHGFTIEGLQDYGAGGPDATLNALLGAAAFAVTAKASSGTTTTTNPEYQGNFVLEHYDPMSGKIGELAKFTASFKPAGALTRATS